MPTSASATRHAANGSDLALVFTGGGARAAYQVGFLRVLARHFPDVSPGILTGVSAGGINAAYLAARQEPFAEKVENLARVWTGIHIEDVFKVDLRDLASRTVRWGGRLLSGGRSPLPPARSLVDTEPLRELLERLLETDAGVIPGIARSLERRLASSDRADSLELYDRAVDDVGPDARGLRHQDLGASAAHERRLHASHRPRDGLVIAAVLLSRDRTGRRLLR